MKLYEYEGKQLLKAVGIPIPLGGVVKQVEQVPDAFGQLSPHTKAFAVKAQILAGSRGKAGGILFAQTKEELHQHVQSLLHKEIKEELVEELLVEQKLDIAEEYYLGIMFDTKIRSPILILSKEGGVDIEETKRTQPEKVVTEPLDYLALKEQGVNPIALSTLLMKAGFDPKMHAALTEVIQKLVTCFIEHDLKMVEINPLVKTTKQSLSTSFELVAADCVAIMDDDALYRQTKWNFPKRIGVRKKPTERELAAHKINEIDHRGIAGKTFIEFDGDIGILAVGGGCSITAMDSLLSYGVKPANYTEYSGNPSKEKVYELTKLTLSKPGLAGCWMVGGVANFTNVKETLEGFMDAIVEINPDYPVVVRRAGPFDEEAFAYIKAKAKEHDLDVTCYDETMPVSESGKIMAEKVKAYKEKKGMSS